MLSRCAGIVTKHWCLPVVVHAIAGLGGERTRFIHQLWFFGFPPSPSAAQPSSTPQPRPSFFSDQVVDDLAAEHRRTARGVARVSMHKQFGVSRSTLLRRDLQVTTLHEFAGKFQLSIRRVVFIQSGL